ncbi:sulfatase [Aestuariibaculum suncheonense]|uniref:Sulfatase n=1 Tax=Aestuariibaculum suncheonense TaxID=1028745 RepID=A0A8J6QFQ9_9FLAO|nr:sulfatase [Aestuariibaculum suncheonense]MBD0835332.1 sulfatase [Aestuariibaculum suncheonense]
MKPILFIFTIISFSITFAQNNQNNKPNILLINVDDLGWKDVGFMGSAYYNTPNIDSLANQGMVFSNGYAASSNCAPSRACLMTGKWTPRHGIYTVDNSERGKSKDRKIIPTPNTKTLSKDHTIIPQVLSKNGYSTCHAGKWHLSDNPLEFGFQVNIGGGHNGHPKNYYPPYINVNISKGNNEHLTDLITEHAITYIDTISKPFFLYYATYAVHTPIQAIDSLMYKYENKVFWQGQNNAKYATMIENLDRNIGLIVTKLKEKGIFKNTFIVFTSDNGGVYGITQQKPLRAGKGSYYEGGIREPFFFVWQDQIKSHTQSDIPITNLDLFPTLLNVAQIRDTYPLDGNNLLPVLQNQKQDLKRKLYWHFPIYLEAYQKNDNENRDVLFRTRPGSVIRDGKWKLHYYFENNDIELFNLDKDISEQYNLALEHTKQAKKMVKQLKKWWKKTNAPIPTTINPEYKD